MPGNVVTRHPVWAGAVLGAVCGGTLNWILINTAGVEIEAARADGFPLWSWHQVPFVIPGAVMAALTGALVGWIVTLMRTKRRAG
jgi:TctA family transporter